MNSFKQLVIASTLIASTAAMAQEGTQDFEDIAPSTRTRAEVIAERDAAGAEGLLEERGQAYGSFDARKLASTRSRAEAVAELDAARAGGQLDQRGETYGNVEARRCVSTRTRAEVIVELKEALAAGRRLSRGDRS